MKENESNKSFLELNATNKRWTDFFSKYYGDKSLIEFAFDHWNYNLPFYNKIKNKVKPPSKILEIGCGYGLSSIYLSSCGYDVTAIDSNEEVITMAKKSAKSLNTTMNIKVIDAFILKEFYGQFDLCFSAGVIEHFDREETINLLNEQARCAKYVIATIPSKYSRLVYGFTDERIYSIGELNKMFEEAGFTDITTFAYGDISTRFHRHIKYFLPLGVYKLLQSKLSYAMSLGCMGRSTNFN